jgi:transposase-like protein
LILKEVAMAATVEATPDPRLEKRTRRRFGGAEKQRLLSEYEALGHGDKGAWLRRQGLYAGQISVWQKELREGGSSALDPKSPGRKPMDGRDHKIVALEKQVGKLEKRLRVAEGLVELQKKVLALIDVAESETRS